MLTVAPQCLHSPSITCPSIITSLYAGSSVIVTSGMHTHTHTQDPQSTEADTEGIYDLLEKNKPTEELQEHGVSVTPDLQ